MSEEPIRTDPYHQFVQDIIADPDLAPQLSDPLRIPAIEVYAKGKFPDRPPDISTPRTDVYITYWEDKDPDDPFYKDWAGVHKRIMRRAKAGPMRPAFCLPIAHMQRMPGSVHQQHDGESQAVRAGDSLSGFRNPEEAICLYVHYNRCNGLPSGPGAGYGAAECLVEMLAGTRWCADRRDS